MGCRMSLKMRFLHSHLEFFLENLEAVGDEHGEKFRLDFKSMEERYERIWNEGMMGDDCWMLYCDDANHPYKQKSYVKQF